VFEYGRSKILNKDDAAMKTFLLLTFFTITISTHAIAQPTDPVPDGINLYFDQGATEFCRYFTNAPFEAVTAYICMTRISAASGVSSWQATVTVDGDILVPTWQLAAGWNSATAPTFQVDIGTADPLPWAESIVVATFEGYVHTPEDRIYFSMQGVDGPQHSPSYTAGDDTGDERDLHMRVEVPGTPVCAINDPYFCDYWEVENEISTWSDVKALYR